MDEQVIEQELQTKGKLAPRLTPELIDAQISSEVYFNGMDALYRPAPHKEGEPPHVTVVAYKDAESLQCLTICVLVLKNGFTLVGKSACASPANYDLDIGRKLAREDARRQIWALEGYVLKSKLQIDAIWDAINVAGPGAERQAGIEA